MGATVGTGGAGIDVGRGGGSSVTDFFRRRKNDDGFFCSTGWCECEDEVSREGGVEPLESILEWSAEAVECGV